MAGTTKLGAALENFLLGIPKKLFLVPCMQLKVGEQAVPIRIFFLPLPRQFHPTPVSSKSTPMATNL
jgi:hypothetical protein